jgi:hypothetical protein
MAQTSLDNVVTHWHKLIGNFQTSPKDFYDSVETALEQRKIPGLKVSRVKWSEGGVLSPNREYLRVEGGRHTFDMCAAPFGTGFFFSSWMTTRKPSAISRTIVAVLVLAPILWKLPGLFDANRAGVLPDTLNRLFMMFWGPAIITFFVALFLVGAMARAGKVGPELAVMATPVVGAIYRAFFLQETYYRIDTVLMFQSAAHSAMLEAIDGQTTQKGVRGLTEDERKPAFNKLM